VEADCTCGTTQVGLVIRTRRQFCTSFSPRKSRTLHALSFSLLDDGCVNPIASAVRSVRVNEDSVGGADLLNNSPALCGIIPVKNGGRILLSGVRCYFILLTRNNWSSSFRGCPFKQVIGGTAQNTSRCVQGDFFPTA
jgi:hypothetical protein